MFESDHIISCYCVIIALIIMIPELGNRKGGILLEFMLVEL